MKKLPIAAALCAFSTSSFAALDCRLLDEKMDPNGGYTYFKEVPNAKLPSGVEEEIVRAAVVDLYGKCGETQNPYYCYDPKMTYQEIVELGETAYTITYEAPSGDIYYAVNVGFGGGNSAIYYFDSKTLEMEKIMTVDNAECTPIQSILGYDT